MKYHLIVPILAILLLIQGSASAVNVRDVTFTTRNAGKVVFRHSDHIHKKAMNNNCRACHDALFDLKRKKRYSMTDMEKGKSCGACHDGAQAFPLKACARCHQTREKIYRVKVTGATVFSHSAHLATTADCAVCHPTIFAAGPNKRFSMAEMKKGKSCGACHNGKKAFSVKECSKCHPTGELLFDEKSTGNVMFSHKAHIALYVCVDCHTSLFKPARSKVKVSMQEMENGKSCGACHEGKTAFSVKEKCDSCHKM